MLGQAKLIFIKKKRVAVKNKNSKLLILTAYTYTVVVIVVYSNFIHRTISFSFCQKCHNLN